MSSGSLPPNVLLNYPSSLTAITSTSVVPVQVTADDTDGVVDKVEYYIDGELERTVERIRALVKLISPIPSCSISIYFE